MTNAKGRQTWNFYFRRWWSERIALDEVPLPPPTITDEEVFRLGVAYGFRGAWEIQAETINKIRVELRRLRREALPVVDE